MLIYRVRIDGVRVYGGVFRVYVLGVQGLGHREEQEVKRQVNLCGL